MLVLSQPLSVKDGYSIFGWRHRYHICTWKLFLLICSLALLSFGKIPELDFTFCLLYTRILVSTNVSSFVPRYMDICMKHLTSAVSWISSMECGDTCGYTVWPWDTKHPANEFSTFESKFSEKNVSTYEEISSCKFPVWTCLGQNLWDTTKYNHILSISHSPLLKQWTCCHEMGI